MTFGSGSIFSLASPSPAQDVELRLIAEHADPEVRMRALALLTAHGDAGAAAKAAARGERSGYLGRPPSVGLSRRCSPRVEARASTSECSLISSWIPTSG